MVMLKVKDYLNYIIFINIFKIKYQRIIYMVRKITKPQMAKLVENNYGSIYKSSGGGKAQAGGMPVKKFMKKY